MNSAQQAAYDAADELRDVVAKAEELMDAVGEDGSDALAQLKERVNGTIRNAKDRLSSLDTSARQAATEAAETADEYVTTYPWTAVAVAAAVGAIAGAVLSRRG